MVCFCHSWEAPPMPFIVAHTQTPPQQVNPFTACPCPGSIPGAARPPGCAPPTVSCTLLLQQAPLCYRHGHTQGPTSVRLYCVVVQLHCTRGKACTLWPGLGRPLRRLFVFLLMREPRHCNVDKDIVLPGVEPASPSISPGTAVSVHCRCATQQCQSSRARWSWTPQPAPQ